MKFLLEFLLPLFPLMPSAEISPKLPDNALAVPLLEQKTDYSCGAAALLALLQYWNGYTDLEESLYQILGTHKIHGTLPEKIMMGGRTFGLETTMVSSQSLSDLQMRLANQETLILELQAWPDAVNPRSPWKDMWENGHYVILVGMDEAYAYFSDPSVPSAYAYIPLSELLDRWHDINETRPNPYPKKDFQLLVSLKGGTPVTKTFKTRDVIRLE